LCSVETLKVENPIEVNVKCYCLFEKVDLVIAVGYDIVECDLKKWNKIMNLMQMIIAIL